MIVKKATGSVFPVNTTCISSKGLLDIFIPKTTTSNRWIHWKATIDLKTCIACLDHHGRIYRRMNISNKNHHFIGFVDV